MFTKIGMYSYWIANFHNIDINWAFEHRRDSWYYRYNALVFIVWSFGNIFWKKYLSAKNILNCNDFLKLAFTVHNQCLINVRPTFFYYLFYGTADPIFVIKRIKIKVHDCCFIFIYSSDSSKNPSARNKRKSVANFDWRNQKPAANHQLVFSPGIRRNYLGFAFNSDGGPK